MAIILQSEPAARLQAATLDSNKLLYVVDISINTGSPTRPNVDAVLEVDFIVNGNVINTEQYNLSTYIYSAPNIHIYRFSIDAQENVQAFFDDSNLPLADLFLPLQTSTASIHAVLQFEFRAWQPNGNDLLELQPGSQVSNLRDVINAIIRHEDTQDLIAFDNNVVPAAAEWLSEKPQSLSVLCRNDDEQLAGWDMGVAGDITGITFTGYNSVGAAISIGSMTGIAAFENQITVFSVGPQNINNASGWALTPAVLPSSPLMRYYTIRISSVGKSVTKTYYLKDACCTRHRFYFRNRLGFFDTFDVEDYDVQSYKITSERYEKEKASGYSLKHRGYSKITSIGQNTWELSKIKLSQEESSWLKQFLNSTEVYMQTQEYAGSSGAFLRPVMIRDGEFDLVDKTTGLVEFNFIVDAANTDKSQRN